MDTFGERLKTAREARGLCARTVAETLGVDAGLLRALERDDYGALPDEATMMACLRGYASCLAVDADLMIEDYARERETCLRRLAAAVPDRATATPSVAIRSEPARRPRARHRMALTIVAAAVLLGAWWMLSGERTVPTPDAPVTTPSIETRAIVSETRSTAPLTRTEPVAPPVPVTTNHAPLRVPDYGVGSAVRNRRLVGQAGRFREGGQVWFWTRVEGGRSGERVDHVWLRNGVEATRTSLRLGGPTWRTFSARTLREDSSGDWAVEAQDGTGRVLARSEFLCVP